MVVVDQNHFDELFNAPNTELHAMRGTLQDFDFRHVFRADIFDQTHVDCIRFELTQNIPALTPEIKNELMVAIEEGLGSVVTKGMI